MAKVVPTAWQDLDKEVNVSSPRSPSKPPVRFATDDDDLNFPVSPNVRQKSDLKIIGFENSAPTTPRTPRSQGRKKDSPDHVAFRDAVDALDHSAPVRPGLLAPIVSKLPVATVSRRSSLSNNENLIKEELSFAISPRVTESILDNLFNYIAKNTNELSSGKAEYWAEFSLITFSVCNSLGSDKLSGMIRKFLSNFGYTTTYGWPRDANKSVGFIFQYLANIYLLNSAVDDEELDYREDILNIEALTFCPNSLFLLDGMSDSEQAEPQSETMQCALLLADISGFSKFAGKMCLQGARGLDTLHKVTNEFLGLFVNAVYKFHGDVISFAGDALLCIFPVGIARQDHNLNKLAPIQSIGQACEMALQCAYFLKDNKLHSLSAHFAVSCGPMQFGMLGGVNSEWTYLMNGSCTGDISDLIDIAQPQQVVCSVECYENAIQSGDTIVTRSSGITPRHCVLIENITRAKAPSFETVNPQHDVTRNLLLLEDSVVLNIFVENAEHFIPRPVLNALSAGSLTSIAELRRITTLFLKLDSYSPVDNANVLSLQPFFVLFQEILLQSGGFLRQFLIDDKGCVVIAMWGVPSYTHHNDSLRGLFCAWNISTRISEVGHRCSIGLTTGYAYCGLIGSPLRRDYACVGDKVNLAARLMSKAKGKVLVDPDLYAAVSSEGKRSLEKSETLTLKGVANPVTPYKFTESAQFTTLRASEEEEMQSILRKDVIQKLLAVLDVVAVGQAIPFLSHIAAQNSDLNSAILVGDAALSARENKAKVTLALDENYDSSKTNRESNFTSTSSIQVSSRQPSRRFSGFLNFFSRKEKENSQNQLSSRDIEFTPKSGKSVRSLRHRFQVSPDRGEDDDLTSGYSKSQFNNNSSHSNSSTARKAAQENPDECKKTYIRENCKIVIVSGMAGTGKSACAKFFRKSCNRRNIPCSSVHCRTDDEMFPYSAFQKIFWEIAGHDKYRTATQRKELIAKLMCGLDQERSSDAGDELLEYVSDLLVDDTDVKKKMAALYNKGKQSEDDDDDLETKSEAQSHENSTIVQFSRLNSEEVDHHAMFSRLVSEEIKSSHGNHSGFARRLSNSGLQSRPLSADLREDGSKGFGRNSSEDISKSGLQRKQRRASDDPSGFGRKSSNGSIDPFGFGRRPSNSLPHKRHADEEDSGTGLNGHPDNATNSFAAQAHQQVEFAMESFLGDSNVENALESLRFKHDHTFSPDDVNSTLVGLVRGLMRPVGHTALIIEDAHYCDELTWIVISQLQKADLRMVILVTLVNPTLQVIEDESALISPLLNPSDEGGNSAGSFDQKFGQSFQQASSYALISSCSATSNIQLSELGRKEVGDVLRHVVGTDVVLPPNIEEKVLAITSGNVFWVKQVAKYITENGFSDFLETIDKGSAIQALQKIIMCRFEKLTTEQQIVVKHASVIGQEFAVRTLAAVLPASAIHKLKQSILALKEMGILYGVEDKSLALFGFHNALTRDTICSIVPPSDISEIHLKAAKYIEAQFANNLRQYYHSLSYHYSFTTGHRRNAFKYTMKAADQAISRGAFRFGFNLLKRAQTISRSVDEFEVVEKVLDQGLQDILRFKTKSPKLDSSVKTPFSRQGNLNGASDANLIKDYQALKELVQNQIEPPITVNVHSSDGGQKQTLQLKPMIYHAPLFSLKEVSERDFFGPMKMLSFLSSKSINGIDQVNSARVDEQAPSNPNGPPVAKPPKPRLRFQLSYTGSAAANASPVKAAKYGASSRNLEDQIEEELEGDDESSMAVSKSPDRSSPSSSISTRESIRRLIVGSVATIGLYVGTALSLVGYVARHSFVCGGEKDDVVDQFITPEPPKIPLVRRPSLSGEDEQ